VDYGEKLMSDKANILRKSPPAPMWGEGPSYEQRRKGQAPYRIRKFGSEEFEDVSEEEYLSEMARRKMAEQGTLGEREAGPHILAEVEKGEDIELKQEKRKAKRDAKAKKDNTRGFYE
jgi:hypothetical protein